MKRMSTTEEAHADALAAALRVMPMAGPRHDARVKSLQVMEGYFAGVDRGDFGLVTFAKSSNVTPEAFRAAEEATQ